MALATLLSTPLTLVPTLPIAAMAATAIREAISVYSMAVAPFSFFIRRRKMDSMGNLQNDKSVQGRLWGEAALQYGALRTLWARGFPASSVGFVSFVGFF